MKTLAAVLPAEALPFYERAAALDAEFGPAYHMFAISLAGVGRSNEALAAFDRAIEIRCGHTEAESKLNELLRRVNC